VPLPSCKKYNTGIGERQCQNIRGVESADLGPAQAQAVAHHTYGAKGHSKGGRHRV